MVENSLNLTGFSLIPFWTVYAYKKFRDINGKKTHTETFIFIENIKESFDTDLQSEKKKVLNISLILQFSKISSVHS